MARSHISDLILAFIEDYGVVGEWDWDDFISRSRQDSRDVYVEAARREVLRIETECEDENTNGWLTEKGHARLRRLAEVMRQV